MGRPLQLQGTYMKEEWEPMGSHSTQRFSKKRERILKRSKKEMWTVALLHQRMSTLRLGRGRKSMIIKSLKDEGRKLELLWKASTKGTIYLEQQRWFRPTALQGLGINDQVPSPMLLAALTVWDHGEELPAHDLPLECRKFIENLPGLLSATPVNTGSSLEIHRDISLTPLPIHEEWGLWGVALTNVLFKANITQNWQIGLETKLSHSTLHYLAHSSLVFNQTNFCAVCICKHKFRNYNVLTKV